MNDSLVPPGSGFRLRRSWKSPSSRTRRCWPTGRPTVVAGAGAWNPVFDVTPAALIDVIVTERGIVEKPDAMRMKALFGAASVRAANG